ncbi:MAG TPA: MaoC/PaaZ C-terminal domain-containing protein [Gammaproteobacteria bacterium]|nr:MaoC/PaaZ C-terminal domain-containing protein [Gammaproteobacteria bacterium]
MQSQDDFLINYTFDEIQLGDTASVSHQLTEKDIHLFAIVSGDINPAHVDVEYAKTHIFHKVVAHGMWGGALISTVLGTKLPGPGAIYLSQSLKFLYPVGVGDTITATVTVTQKFPGKHHVELACQCTNQDGKIVIEGVALVLAPVEKICREKVVLPEVVFKD